MTATFAMLAGLAIAWNNYIREPGGGVRLRSPFPGHLPVRANKWYFDELYDRIFVRPAIWLGRLFWRRGDEGTIDRFGPHGAAVRGRLRQPPHHAAPVGLPLQLRVRDAARPRRRGSWAIWWAR
jgi:NADH-quinone oxidoreductase subunit L